MSAHKDVTQVVHNHGVDTVGFRFTKARMRNRVTEKERFWEGEEEESVTGMDEKSITVRISPTSQLVVGSSRACSTPVSKIGANCDRNAGRTDSENIVTPLEERARVDVRNRRMFAC